MTNFPTLQENQVALARAQKATGIILDEQFNVHISELNEVYTIFEGMQQAIAYVDSVKGTRNDVEFIIYDRNQSVLSFIQ